MKKQTFLTCAALLITTMLAAQQQDKSDISSQANIIKINLPALIFKNYSFQYERQLGHKTSFAIAARYRPEDNIPFQSIVKKMVDDTLIRVDLMKVGNIGITPEFRYYLGKKGVFHGFYIGPFISFNRYSGQVPVNYYDYVNNVIIDKTATFKGNLTTITGGIQIGGQWRLRKHWYVDYWLIGANYGISNGDFDFVGSLNDIERLSLQYEVEKIRQTIPLIKIEMKEPPTANGASFKVNGPWAGLRAGGIGIGYRF